VLIVERFDNEGLTRPHSFFLIPERLRAVVPDSVRRLAKSILLERVYSSTSFVEDITQSLSPDMRYLSIVAGDISQQQNYSFDSFVMLIAQSACVHATRLHAAVLAAMLEKPTVLYAGKNHKFRGIYDLSLSHLDHVTLE
jgi:exopolysaccharide biosynthesis predicted pyruvyltransferase EpsI